jgi:vacuolar-type H+-ATPase subunit H
MIKKLFIGFFSFIVLLVGAGFAVPYFFKDKIMAAIKTEANKNLNAKMDFKDVNFSVWRSFPNISVGLEQFSIEGIERFKGIKLIQTERFDVALDIMSAIRGDKPMKINSIWLDKPSVYVRVLSDGTANYNITKPDSTKKAADKGKPSEFALQLSRYGITDGILIYDDEKRGAYVDIKGLNHSGSGDFTANNYDLATETDMRELTTSYGAVTYLTKAKIDANLTIGVDNKNSKYTFKNDVLKVNDLELDFGGWLSMLHDIDMDFNFKTKSADFKSLFSLVPSAYTADYKDVQASGKAAFDGWVKGKYNDNSYPALSLNIKAENAKFKYPKLPMGMDDINTEVHIKSPNKDFDNLAIDVPKLHFRLGANPFDATFFLKTPMSDPDIKSTAKGTINLADFSKAFPVEGLNGGIVKADVRCNTRLSSVTNAQYEKVDMAGDATVTGLTYKSKDYPKIYIQTLSAIFSPSNVTIPNFVGILGKSDVMASGLLDNPLAYYSGVKTVKGKLTMRSNSFDANEWMGKDDKKAEPNRTVQSTPAAATTEKPFDRFDFEFDGDMKKFAYGKYNVRNLLAKGHVTPQLFKCDNFEMLLGNSDMKMNGEISNIFGYLYGKDVLKGNLNFNSTFFDLNQFMGEGDKAPTEKPQNVPVDTSKLEPIEIPANIDMVVNATIGTLPYDTYILKNCKGQVILRDQKATLSNFYTQLFGGTCLVSGTYDSKVKDKRPKFNFNYKLDKMDFQQVVKNVASAKKFAPIMQYIDGSFSTSMKMDGTLKPDLMPDFNSLSGLGDLITMNAAFRDFKPLDEVATKLNMPELKGAKVINTKNWFELNNGRMIVKPFDYKIKDILVNISGSHGLASDMDYMLKFKVPRAVLERAGVQGTVNKGFDLLNQQAGKLGMNIKQAEFIFFNVKMGGTMLKPTTKIEFVNAEGKSVAKAVEDKVKETVKETIDNTKKQAEDLAKQQAEKAKTEAKRIADEAAQKARAAAEKAARDAIKNKTVNADSLRKAAEDIIKGGVGQGQGGVKTQVDEVKKGVEDIFKNNNPFKKKN